METLLYISPWNQSYSYNVEPSQVRTRIGGGFKKQEQRSHRYTTVAKVERRLFGIELPYFEYFIREVLNDAADKYNDSYIDGNGITTGAVRIVDGKYKVKTDGRVHIVSCELELFR